MDQGQTGEYSLEPRQGNDMEVKNWKVLKADRERLRREKLNEHFLELGNLLDPDKPKNDKGSIVADTIQVLKDLNSQVKKLKADHAVLCEESRELIQEKTELREEKASLKSDIHDLKQQHQRTQGFMVPWAAVDPSMLMAPSYPFPVALPVPSGSIPMHQMAQPLPLYVNQHSATSPFIPYLAPHVIPRINQSTLNVSTSYISGPPSSCNKFVNDVETDLELKIPGSTAPKGLSTKEKGKQPEKHQEKSATNGSSLSKSPSKVFQDSSSDSIDDL